MVSTRQMSHVGGSGTSSTAARSSESTSDLSSPRSSRHTGPSTSTSTYATLQSAPSPQPQYAPTVSPGSPMPVAIVKPAKILMPPPAFTTNILDLPYELITKIISFLKYKNVCQLRLVCRQFNNICSCHLNSAFQKQLSDLLQRHQIIKSKMPRRESARRSHPLACESDIIETTHMRLALLQMTMGKHIERKFCCFFPGEILDEVCNILENLKVITKLTRPIKMTDELFDLSSMAMEYFKEHMQPNLPEITYYGTEFFDITGTFSPSDSNKYAMLDSPPASSSRNNVSNNGDSGLGQMFEEDCLPPSPPPPQSNMVLRKRIHRIKQGMKRYNNQLSALRSDLRSCKRKTAWQQKQIAEQQRQLAEQQKQTMDYATRLDENDKKNEETSRKFQTLLQELNKCRTELQYWRSKSPATTQVLCGGCGTPTDLPPPNALQLGLEQDVTDVDLWGVPTVVEPSIPPVEVDPSTVVATVPAALEPLLSLDNPLSPKASVSKMPGSPTARRPTLTDAKPPVCEDVCINSKRNSCDGISSPPDSKKRRFNRTSKPRKL